MAYVNYENLPSENTPLTGGASGNLNVMQENGTSHGTDTKLGYAQSFLNDHLVNVSNEVDEDYRVNLLKSNNIIDSTNFQSGAISINTGQKVDYGTRVCTINKIPVKSSTKYAITMDTTTSYSFLMIVDAYSEDGTYLGRISNTNGNVSGTYVETQATAKYINITLRDTTDSQVLSATFLQYLSNGSLQIQLVEGETSLPYEPYITPSIYVDNEMLVSKNVYSTSEVVIGEWLGKPLYRKVFNIPQTTISSSGATTINLISNNTLIPTKIEGMIGFTTSNTYYPLTGSANRTATGYQVRWQNAQNLQIVIDSGQSAEASVKGGYVILEYTKTTDA